jgi:hypothetical protein
MQWLQQRGGRGEAVAGAVILAGAVAVAVAVVVHCNTLLSSRKTLYRV